MSERLRWVTRGNAPRGAERTATTMRADEVLHIMQKRHAKDIWLTEVKDGSTWLRSHHRLDALAIRPSWTQPRFVGYEVKVSRADFLRDDKWDAYLPLTHQFSFACPWDLIQPAELPDMVGLYWVQEDGKLKQVRKPVLRPMDGLPTDLLYYVIMSRCGSEHHPFFTNAREAAEAYVADQMESRWLGSRLGTKMAARLGEAERENKALQERLDRKTDELGDLVQQLVNHGLPAERWDLDRRLGELQAAAQGIVEPQALQQMERAAKVILQTLNGLKSAVTR